MTTQRRRISDEDLVEIAGGGDPIIDIGEDRKTSDRKHLDGGIEQRPGGDTIPFEPVGGGASGSASDLF